MKTVFFRGPILTRSGYGVHCRQALRPLLDAAKNGSIRLHCDLTNWGNSSWDVSSPYVDEVRQYTVPKGIPDVAVQVGTPSDFVKVDCPNIGITAGIETTLWSAKWNQDVAKMSHLVFPSEFSKNGYLGQIPTTVIPESYSPKLLSAEGTLPLKLERDFYFLLVGQITGDAATERKAILSTVDALRREFANDDRVGIIVKASTGRNNEYCRIETRDLLKRHISSTPSKCEVVLVHGNLSEEEMGLLYRHPKVRAYVTATHGEGFGLPILEAAVCGLPVIATGWSAHVEYLGKRYVDLPYRLSPVPVFEGMADYFAPGANWAVVQPQDIMSRCRKVYEKYDVPNQWAKSLQSDLTLSHSTESVYNQYCEFYKGMGVLT